MAEYQMIYMPIWTMVLIAMIAFAFGAFLGLVNQGELNGNNKPTKVSISSTRGTENCDVIVSRSCDVTVESNAKKSL